MLGKLVSKKHNTNAIGLKHLSSGTYFVEITANSQKTLYKKLIKN